MFIGDFCPHFDFLSEHLTYWSKYSFGDLFDYCSDYFCSYHLTILFTHLIIDLTIASLIVSNINSKLFRLLRINLTTDFIIDFSVV